MSRPYRESVRAQRQDRVGDSELRRVGKAGAVVLADPERADRQRRQASGQIVQEAAEGAPVGRVHLQRLEAVDHHQAGTALLEQLGDPGQHAGQPVVVQRLAEIVVDHPAAERGRVEVRQRLPVAQDLLEWFGHRREVQGGTFGGRVPEQVLLSQDRLTRAGTSDHKRDAVERQAPAENGVQAIGAAQESVGHQTRAPRR